MTLSGRMTARYSNLPLRTKLLLWFVPLFVVMIASTGYYAYSTAANEIVARMTLEQTGMAKQAVDHLDYIAFDAESISDYIFLTPEIQSLLSGSSDDRYIINRNVVDSINRLMVTKPYIQYFTIYSSRFPAIQFNNKGLSSAISFEEYREKFQYEAILSDPVIEHWSIEVPGRPNSIFHGDTMNKLLLTKVLKNDTTMKPEGLLILGIDEKEIRRSYSPALGQTRIVVIHDDGTILSDSEGAWIGHGMGELPYFNKKIKVPGQIDSAAVSSNWIISHLQSPVTGWHILVIQPKTDLLQHLNHIKWITLLIVCLTLVISFFVSWAAAGVMAKPMKAILSSMKKFQRGDFAQKVSIRGMDELGQLGSGYNIMVQKVRDLVQDVYAFEIRQRQAEIKVLQSQINPHFLYNTLNTIAWTAEKIKDYTVAEMVYSLSGMLKISLSEGKEIIDLQKEIQLSQHYLFLQQKRFPDKLAFEIAVSPELGEFSIPKLLIQPLVENAVVHGIEPLNDDAGLVQISGALSPDKSFIIINIVDNGVGIPEEELQSLKDKLQEENLLNHTGESFALINIKNRLRLFYGDRADLLIHSVAGFGTRVELTIPYIAR